MSKRITITAARRVADLYNCEQVIILAWDGQRTHIVTYGTTRSQCQVAAKGGEQIAEMLGLKDRNLLGDVENGVWPKG